MLIFLLIFTSIRTLRGVPLSSPLDTPDGIITNLDPRDTQTHFGQRGINDIIISCFATILACYWSAIHPNIPAVTDSAWTCFKRRVTITICALLAPEMMTWWAMNQRWAAKDIVDKYNQYLGEDYLIGQDSDEGESSTFDAIKGWFKGVFGFILGLFKDSPLPVALVEGKGPRWTLAHGFFLQMGGFMMCENGIPSQVLTQDTRTHKETGIIYNITQEIIAPPRIIEEDIKDRSKGDVISKTFILLQTTWFIVQCIARWSQRLPVTELEIVTLGFAMLNGITYGLWWHKPQHVDRPVFLERKISREGLNVNSAHTGTEANIVSNAGSKSNSPPVEKSWLRHELRKDIQGLTHSPTPLWRVPVHILLALFRPLRKMAGYDKVTEMRVGMFYTGFRVETQYPVALIGLLFGTLHLIPSWFLDFPSRQEMWLWRVSAIIITVEPILVGSMPYLKSAHLDTLHFILALFMWVGVFLYPISRIILFTLSLTGLRSLPPPALQTIEWITFFPHI